MDNENLLIYSKKHFCFNQRRLLSGDFNFFFFSNYHRLRIADLLRTGGKVKEFDITSVFCPPPIDFLIAERIFPASYLRFKVIRNFQR